MTVAQDWFGAITRGDSETVKTLLQQQPELGATRNEAGLSGVLLALYRGQSAIAEFLIAQGVELDLFDAAAVGATERVRQLLDERPTLATVYAQDGFQALHLASYFNHPEVVKLLIERGADVNLASQNNDRVMPLHAAMAGQAPEVVHVLLAHGADVQARQTGGFTALHSAAQNGNAEMVKLLLERGADLTVTTDEGKTGLDFARAGGHGEVIKILEV